MNRRRSVRLRDYDYTQNGVYFVTICTHDKMSFFGRIDEGLMLVNDWGKIVQTCWDALPQHFPQIETDAFVVMPNHLHGIILIQSLPENPVPSPRQFSKPIAGSLPTMVGSLKSAVSKHVNRLRDDRVPLWQGRYYEHIIRNEDDLNRIRAYIETNPQRWTEDVLFM